MRVAIGIFIALLGAGSGATARWLRYQDTVTSTTIESNSQLQGNGSSLREADEADEDASSSATGAPRVTALMEDEGTTAPPAATVTTAPTCSDDTMSWSWPTTTQGPVILCPENPMGVPDWPVAATGSGWIAVLDSINILEIPLANERMAIMNAQVGAQLYDSRMYLGLRDPYWVVFVGPFVSEDEAASFCNGNPSLATCYPRQL